jgi:signal transduction histidine kinase
VGSPQSERGTAPADTESAARTNPTDAQPAVPQSPDGGRTEDDEGPPDGGVIVEVGTLDDAPGFFVADDGTGIPEDARDNLFEMGYTTDVDGTGFGLAIVESVADAHDWNVTVAESEDGGARFEFQTGG